MGYYTRYSLKADMLIGGKVVELANTTPLVKIIEKFIDTNLGAGEAMTLDGASSDTAKWYAHEAELKGFSTMYDNVLFTLSGEGEEAGDIWAKYFVNGKMQYAKAEVRVESFDSRKLV